MVYHVLRYTMRPSPAAQDRLQRLIERLDRELDPETERRIDGLHRSALQGEEVPRLPVVVSCPEPLPEDLAPYPFCESFVDPAKMLFNELVTAWGTSVARRGEMGDDLPTTVRANLGTVLVVSSFGAEVEQHGDDPPWARHLDSQQEFVAALETGGSGPGPTSSLVERAVEFMQYYREILEPFETLGAAVKITLPDLQGPLDSAAMLRGGELFLDAVTDPELFQAALARMADVQIELWRRFQPLTMNETPGLVHQHGVVVAGNILIRDDSSVMISPEMYEELVAPAEARVLDAVGGGAIHSCGSIDHVFGRYLAHAKLYCVDYGQSWLNDIDSHYTAARNRGVGLARVRAERPELATGAILDRFPTGVVLTYDAPTVAEAQRTIQHYHAAASRRATATAGRQPASDRKRSST
jgi:hypothetical protein